MKIRAKLLISSLSVLASSLIGVSAYIGWMSLDSGKSALETQSRNQLVSIRDIKKSQIEDYFKSIGKKIITFSNDRMIIDAAKTFRTAFKQFPDEVGGDFTSYQDSI